ncbi:MAG: Nif3-like dinuclear metal center hexameric protein [Bacteroidetes bacterium]|nr:Nif3-like dinuclear metal center hexameric protein [Bacteroidota bacterium]
MKIEEIISCLEGIANPVLQESYDNAGLLTGDSTVACSGVLITLDATQPVISEAIEKKCNLIVAHHPIIFGGLKKINGKNYVEKTIISAIKNDIAIYAIHTNLDNILQGVNGKIADMLGLVNRSVMISKSDTLKKLFTFVPVDYLEVVRNAIFNAGAGQIGNYTETSFSGEGIGSFKAGSGANPFVGEQNKRHYEKEFKIEVIFPAYKEQSVVNALKSAHPYEEVAYDIVELANEYRDIGSGLKGELVEPMNEQDFLSNIKKVFRVPVIRHTRLTGRPVKKVGVCGGAGSFLISKALVHNLDFYITADVKYHEFFDANDRLVIADIGHFESEQFTVELLYDILREKFPNFAVLKSGTGTNPVNYYY